MNKTNDKIKRLYEFNVQNQGEEEELIAIKKQWRILGKQERSKGQKINEMIKTLREMI